MAENDLWEELNTTSLPLALRVLKLYDTEGGITTCSRFLIFLPSTFGIGPFWTMQALPPASLSSKGMMVLWYLKILDNLQAKYGVMGCYRGMKVTAPEEKYLQWQTNSSKEPGLLRWIFSKLL